MPTVTIIRGYRFFFFSLDRGEPPHIHIEKGDSVAKFWLKPVALARSKGFRQHELSRIRQLVEKHQPVFLRAWNEFFKSES